MSAACVHITAGPYRGVKGERVPADDTVPDGYELIRIRSTDGYTIVSVDSRHVLGVPAPPRNRERERLEALDLWLTPYDGGAEHFFPGPPGTLARREGDDNREDNDMPKRKTVPPIRVGTKRCTFVPEGVTLLDGEMVYHCELTALRVDGEPVEQVDPDISTQRHNVRGDLRAPDGREFVDVRMGRGFDGPHWSRPFISSMRIR